jgi:hypothetical protein
VWRGVARGVSKSRERSDSETLNSRQAHLDLDLNLFFFLNLFKTLSQKPLFFL